MDKRNSRNPETHRVQRVGIPSFHFLFSIFFGLLLAGCGAPGEPTPPSPPVPTPVTDLTVRQAGEGVELSFTLPVKTIHGERLMDPPAVEILRGSVEPDGSPDLKSFRVVDTVPGALVSRYVSEGRAQIISPVPPEEVRAHRNVPFAYRVRTRASRRRASPESNIVTIRVLPAAERISSIKATVTELAIELAWQPPMHTSTGAPLADIAEYHIYRGELDPASAEAAAKDLAQAEWKSPLTLLGSSSTSTCRDTTFEFGKTYLYTVRSVTRPEGNPLESSDSTPAVVTPRDIFPPATPQGLTAAVIVVPPTNAPEVDLSWSINAEPDLAGYRVYRSEQQDTPGQLVTPDLLLSPSYRDNSVQPGHRYWYTVTAVDRSGNESAPTAPLVVEVVQPSL
jgi:hypothetical protein